MALTPLAAFHYSVDWGGTRTGFSEVSGLSFELDTYEYRDGTDPEYIITKMTGLKKFSNITLKRGIIPADNEFYDWLNTTRLNNPDKRNITISLLNEDHEPVMVWKIKNCFPTKVEGPGLNATGTEAAIETIELMHEGLTIENG